MGLDFEVTPDVLLPNPDTEVLVQLAVERARLRGDGPRLADVGTGSGCVAVSLARFVPGASVVATELSAAAAAVALRNVDRHGLRSRVEVLEGDLLAPAAGRSFDVIAANLPYLPAAAPLPSEVTAQPAGALRGGEAGWELVARLLEEAVSALATGGAILVEIDPPLLPHLRPLAARLYPGHRVHRDLAGRERVLEAWRG